MKYNAIIKIIFALFMLALIVWLVSLRYAYHHHASDDETESIACHNLLQLCGDDAIQVRFSQTPKAMQPFEMQVTVKDAQAVTASFKMADMDMGENTYQMLPQGQVWAAKVTLPVCMHGGGDWILKLEANTSNGVKKLQIPFTSQ